MADQRPFTPQSGGINIGSGSASAGGDLVGRDKIVHNITNVAPEKLSALHQLPPPTADFTGRTQELAELWDAIKSQGIAITGMQGMGGVGKTALALKLADHLKQDYPEGQIYLDLKGVDQSPLTAKDAMAHVIRSFDLSAKPPESETEVTALYRSVLYNKRVLLLMDNAKDEPQVKPLIPPDGSLLIVTSRQHFTLPGLFNKNLDVLSPQDAEAMLCRIAPRLKEEKKEEIAELARICGFLPLALETVAKALKVKAYIVPSTYTDRLRDAQERLKLTAVDASLELSYEILPKALQAQFRQLAVFPDSFDMAAVAAIWELDPTMGQRTETPKNTTGPQPPPAASSDDRDLENRLNTKRISDAVAQDALGELLLYSLVEFNQATARYRLHDLVRLFAGERLSTEERETAQQRHSGHYLQVLGEADDLYEKGGESVLKGLAIFDLEWTNIRQGQSWAASHAMNDNAAADWCFGYPDQGAYSLPLRQHPRERIGWLEAAVSAARARKNRQKEAAALGNLGIAYDELSEYRRAIEYHEQDLQIEREIGNRRGESTALGNLALAYRNLGEYRRAIEYGEQAVQIARETGYRRGEGAALVNLGLTYDDLGDYRRAIECHEQSLRIAHEIGDRDGESAVLANLGRVYHSLGEYPRVIEFQEQSLRIKQEIGDRRGESAVLGNLGIAYHSLGEYRRAIEYFERRLKVAREIGDRVGESNALWNSSLALAALGDRALAIPRAEAALNIYQAIESPHAAKVRDRLAQWREEDKAQGKAVE